MSDVIQKIVRRHLDAARKEGRKEGIQEGIKENKECVATDMFKDGMPLDKIAKYSRLAEDAIRNLAKSLGVAVV
ncbi:MAG: hypothetical protein IJU07_01455 [Synergistaceae bacterium]|nr:hypothetical protein [Synergistaceae bacterium]